MARPPAPASEVALALRSPGVTTQARTRGEVSTIAPLIIACLIVFMFLNAGGRRSWVG
jgi:hypothetical protein